MTPHAMTHVAMTIATKMPHNDPAATAAMTLFVFLLLDPRRRDNCCRDSSTRTTMTRAAVTFAAVILAAVTLAALTFAAVNLRP